MAADSASRRSEPAAGPGPARTGGGVGGAGVRQRGGLGVLYGPQTNTLRPAGASALGARPSNPAPLTSHQRPPRPGAHGPRGATRLPDLLDVRHIRRVAGI